MGTGAERRTVDEVFRGTDADGLDRRWRTRGRGRGGGSDLDQLARSQPILKASSVWAVEEEVLFSFMQVGE